MGDFNFFEGVLETPKLYICDVVVTITERDQWMRTSVTEFVIKKTPVTLNNGDFPSEKYKENYYKRVFREHIHKGDYEKHRKNMNITFKNIKFSGNLAYKFDKNVH